MNLLGLNKFNQFLLFLIFISALFPYISFGLNTMDTQPWYIFLSIFFVIFNLHNIRLNFNDVCLLIFFILIILVGIINFNSFDFYFIRAMSSYFGFFILMILFNFYFTKYKVPINLIIITNYIYLIFSILQIVYGYESLYYLMKLNSVGSIFRGQSSLTPEPTYFGLILLIYTWIYLIVTDYRPKFFILFTIILNLLFICFVAKSTLTILLLLVATGVFLLSILSFNRLIKFLFFFIMIFLFFFLVTKIFSNYLAWSRYLSLLTKLSNFQQEEGFILGIVKIIEFDASINDRVLNIVFPYMGFIMNFGLPGGFYTYSEISIRLSELTSGYFWSGFGSNKILSFLGTFIYELGFIGILILSFLYFQLSKVKISRRKYEILFLFLLLSNALPVANPFVALLIVLLIVNPNIYSKI